MRPLTPLDHPVTESSLPGCACWVGCATGLGDPAWSLSWESPPYCPCCWVRLTNAYHWSTAGQLTMFQNAFTYSARKFRYFR